MPGEPTNDSITEAVDEVAPLLVGVGIIVFALFPLSLPLIALTLLLAVPLLAVSVVAGLLLAPVILVRRLTRRGPRHRDERATDDPRPRPRVGRPADGVDAARL